MVTGNDVIPDTNMGTTNANTNGTMTKAEIDIVINKDTMSLLVDVIYLLDHLGRLLPDPLS